MAFTCAKNSLETGRENFLTGKPSMETLPSCELEWYMASCLLAQALGIKFYETNSKGEKIFIETIPLRKKEISGENFEGVVFQVMPYISIMPSFGATFTEMKSKIQGEVTVSQ